MKFPQYLLIIILALGAGYVGAQWGQPKNTQTTTAQKETAYDRVMRTGVLRCGYNFWAPGVSKNDKTGEFEGFIVDMMNEIGRVLQIKIEWTTLADWGTYSQDLTTHKFDAFCGGSWEGGRRATMALHLPIGSYQSLKAFVRSDDVRFTNSDDLNLLNNPNVKIGSFEQTPVATTIAENFPKAHALPMAAMASDAEMMMDLSTKKIDVGISNPGIAYDFQKKVPGKIKVFSEKPLRTHANTVAVQSNELQLYKMLESAINELQNAGITGRLIDKYNQTNPGAFLKAAPQFSEE